MIFSNQHQLSLFPNESQRYIGIVTYITDPKNLGRVQIKCPGVYPKGSDWIGIQRDCIVGASPSNATSYGTFGVPPVGAEVIFELQNNDPNSAIIVGTRQTAALPNGWSTTAWGWLDIDGNYIQVDKKTFTLFVAASGTYLAVDSSGNITIYTPGTITTNCTTATVNASSGVNINTPTATFSTNVVVNGTLTV